MSRLFKLETVGGFGSIAPSTGEELGALLARLAAAEMERCVAAPQERVAYWGDRVAQLFHLAADAYEAGAAVTIGHNRSDAYLRAAEGHRKMAEALTGQAKLFRDNAASDRLLGAFSAGFQGGEGKNYAFEMREAYLIGKLFAKEGRAAPSRILKVYAPRPLTRDSESDHLQVDDAKFVVEYPDGRVDNAIVRQI